MNNTHVNTLPKLMRSVQASGTGENQRYCSRVTVSLKKKSPGNPTMAAKMGRNPAVLVARVTPPEEELPPR